MNTNDEKKEKISTRRTYKLLQMALFQLLTEIPFEKISLTEICSRSLVPRSTFYRYFEDKYDLLCYCLQTFFDETNLNMEIICLKDDDALRSFIQIIVEMLEEHRNAFYKIYQLNKDGAFMDILRTFLVQLITEKLKAAEATGSCSNISYPIYTYLLADFYISAAKCYLESDGAYTKEDFIDNICRFVSRDFLG